MVINFNYQNPKDKTYLMIAFEKTFRIMMFERLFVIIKVFYHLYYTDGEKIQMFKCSCSYKHFFHRKKNVKLVTFFSSEIFILCT